MQWTFNLPADKPAEKSIYLTLVAFNNPSSSSICQGSDTKMFFSNPLTHFRWDLIYRLWVYLTLQLRDIKTQIILSVTVPTCFRSGHSFGKIWLWISTFILMIIIHGKRKSLLAEVSWEKLWAHSLPTLSLKPMTDRWMSAAAAGTFIAQSLKQTENQSRGFKLLL